MFLHSKIQYELAVCELFLKILTVLIRNKNSWPQEENFTLQEQIGPHHARVTSVKNEEAALKQRVTL